MIPATSQGNDASDDEAERLIRCIAKLEDTLRRERAAIAQLDAALVESIAQEKQTLAVELAEALAPTAGEAGQARFAGAHHEQLRRELRRLATRLLASAEANRALLADAIDSIASARGLQAPQTGAYDSRARITQRLATGGGKRI